jgi:CheY-like chemotaxis protein
LREACIAARFSSRRLQVFCPESARAFLSGNAADLIIVDCEMPGLNGIELITAI